MPMPGEVQRQRTAGAEVGPQPVASELRKAGARSVQRDLGPMGDAAQRRVEIAIEQQRRERRCRRHDGVTELPRELITKPVASGLRQRLSAGSDDHCPRVDDARVADAHREAVAIAGDRPHPTAGFDHDAEARTLCQQRVQHRPRSIGIRKELSVLLLVESHAELFEERGGTAGRKGAEDMTHVARGAAPEIPLGDRAVGDVTARPAADQDLGADVPGAVQTPDPQMSCPAGRKMAVARPAAPAPMMTRSSVKGYGRAGRGTQDAA